MRTHVLFCLRLFPVSTRRGAQDQALLATEHDRHVQGARGEQRRWCSVRQPAASVRGGPMLWSSDACWRLLLGPLHKRLSQPARIANAQRRPGGEFPRH